MGDELGCRDLDPAEYCYLQMSDVLETAGGSAAAEASTSRGATQSVAGNASFYRYRDPQGRVVIVDSLARVPSGSRNAVETVVLARPEPSVLTIADATVRELHWPSFAAGAGCALVLTLAWLGLRRVGTPLLKLSLLGGLVLLGAGAYFGWLRRVSGHEGPLVASPAALIEDARSAVQKMNERNREQQKILNDLQSER
jgi:hypothetical protein